MTNAVDTLVDESAVDDPPVDEDPVPDLEQSTEQDGTEDRKDLRSNADCPWDLFDSLAYLNKNYASLLAEDELIIARMAEFFASAKVTALRAARTTEWHGIDVGAGTNLYPTLGMLPLAEQIVLWEHAATNKSWLENGILPYSQSWDEFWAALCRSGGPTYSRVRRPRAILPSVAKVQKQSIFKLPEATWDIGTMFFVAESITGIIEEFELATTKFVRCLKPGAPFVAAFMRNSTGYEVGDQRFPAVAITEHHIRGLLGRLGATFDVERIPPDELDRDDYDGMILATGFAPVPVVSTARRRAKATASR
jgi:hypothetical protein